MSFAEEVVSGYEIHMGQTQTDTPWLQLIERRGETVDVIDGAMNVNGRIWGCYLHGLFHNKSVRHAWLQSLGWQQAEQSAVLDDLEVAFERLADHVEKALDMELLDQILENA